MKTDKKQKKEQQKTPSEESVLTKDDFLKALKKASKKLPKPSREKEKKETSE